jgi:hypothetical protein
VPAAVPGHLLTFGVGDSVGAVRVDRDGLFSRDVDLRRVGSDLRGHVGAASVRMALGPGRVTGEIGPSDIGLDVVRNSAMLQVAGRFGSRGIALDLGPRLIAGEVGPCRYDLRLQGDEYVGTVGCGTRPQSARLKLPVALTVRDDVELAAMLTAVLAR